MPSNRASTKENSGSANSNVNDANHQTMTASTNNKHSGEMIRTCSPDEEDGIAYRSTTEVIFSSIHSSTKTATSVMCSNLG
eukprot:4819249-Ditylum_brightwellii.AAC.1